MQHWRIGTGCNQFLPITLVRKNLLPPELCRVAGGLPGRRRLPRLPIGGEAYRDKHGEKRNHLRDLPTPQKEDIRAPRSAEFQPRTSFSCTQDLVRVQPHKRFTASVNSETR